MEIIMGKSKKTKEAIRKAKRKKIITIIICTVVAVLIIAAAVFFILRQSDNRVYVSDSNTIVLSSKGTFEARLYHGKSITGTYTESDENTVTVITFTHDGVTSTGMLAGNSLTIPDEWGDDHGHTYDFTLKK